MIKKNTYSHVILCGLLITTLYHPSMSARFNNNYNRNNFIPSNNRNNILPLNKTQPSNNPNNTSTYSAQDISDAQSIFNTFQADIQALKGYGNFDPAGITTLVTPPIINPSQNLTYQNIIAAFTTWYQQGTFAFSMTTAQGANISIPNYTVSSFKVVYNLYISLAGQASYTTSTGATVAAIPQKSQNACTLFFNSLYTAYKNGLSNNGKTLNPAWLDTWLATNNVQNPIPTVAPATSTPAAVTT